MRLCISMFLSFLGVWRWKEVCPFSFSLSTKTERGRETSKKVIDRKKWKSKSCLPLLLVKARYLLFPGLSWEHNTQKYTWVTCPLEKWQIHWVKKKTWNLKMKTSVEEKDSHRFVRLHDNENAVSSLVQLMMNYKNRRGRQSRERETDRTCWPFVEAWNLASSPSSCDVLSK